VDKIVRLAWLHVDGVVKYLDEEEACGRVLVPTAQLPQQTIPPLLSPATFGSTGSHPHPDTVFWPSFPNFGSRAPRNLGCQAPEFECRSRRFDRGATLRIAWCQGSCHSYACDGSGAALRGFWLPWKQCIIEPEPRRKVESPGADRCRPGTLRRTVHPPSADWQNCR